MASNRKEHHARILGASSRPGTHAMFAVPSSLHSVDTSPRGSMAVYSNPSNPREPGRPDEAGKKSTVQKTPSPARSSSSPVVQPVGEASVQNESAQASLSVPLLHEIVSIRKGIDEVRRSQDAREQSLMDFIQQELHLVKISLASEVQECKAGCLANHKGMQDFLQLRDRHWEAVMHKVTAAESCVVELSLDHDATTQPIKSERSRVDVYADDVWHGEASTPRVESERSRENGVPPVLKSCSRSSEERAWDGFEKDLQTTDPQTMYGEVLNKQIAAKSFWHNVLGHLGCANCVEMSMPNNYLARLTEHSIFIGFQTVLILSNTCIMGYETDLAIKAALAEPREEVPKWLSSCDFYFNIVFAVELLFRIVALRSWFWVAPAEWGWNYFDVCLVITSLLSDLLKGVNLSFLRTLRILRAVRVMRVIRVLRFFRQLRKMLFAILACLSSLAWAFIFLTMIIFMFAILFVQGAAHFIDDLDATSSKNAEVWVETATWWGSLGGAMLSLLASVTGGADWILVRKPIAEAGLLYSIAFVLYTLFVIVGVMNVLTGVFLSSSDEFIDLPLIVQSEQIRVETFCGQMLELFKEVDLSHTGEVDWPTFREALKRDVVRAYLASFQLDPTHMHLLFDLIDEQRTGVIKLQQFVLGMVRLKGEAKAIDARIIERELSMIGDLLTRRSRNMTTEV